MHPNSGRNEDDIAVPFLFGEVQATIINGIERKTTGHGEFPIPSEVNKMCTRGTPRKAL